MKTTGVVIFSAAGSVPPLDYIQRALTNNKRCLGAAAIITVKDDSGNVHHREFEIETIPQTVAPDVMMKMLENYKDYDVLLHMGQSDEPIGPHDLQPFVALRDKDDNVIAVGAIEGEFHPTVRTDTTKGRTEEGLLIEGYLKTKLTKAMKIAGGDLSDFFKELKSDDTEQDLKRTWSNNGTIAILGLNGEVARIEHNASFRRFDWGWVTRHYGYKADELQLEQPVSPPKQEPAKQSMFGKAMSAVSAALPINSGKQEPAKLHLGQAIPPVGTVETELKKAEQTDTAVKPSEGNGRVCRPPMGTMGDKNKLRKWYDRAVGHTGRPANFMEGPAIFVSDERIKEKNLSYREVLSDTTPIAQPDKLPPTAPKEVPKKVEVAPPVTVPADGPVTKVGETTIHHKKPLELVPIIPAENKMKINARLLAIKSNTAVVGIGSQEGSVAPSKVQGVENKLANFSEQLGIKREELLGLSYSDLVGLTRDFPDEMAILCWNLLDSAKAIGLKQKKEGEGEAPITTPAQPTSVPSAGGMFGRAQKAS